MKKLSKVLVLVLSAIMVLAMSASVFAQEKALSPADSDNATITINNPAKGETYSVFKLFDATVSEDGNISYQCAGEIPSAVSAFFTKDSSNNVIPADSIVVKDSTGKVTGTVMTDDLKAALETWANSAQATASEVSNGDATLAFTGLPYGYYVMTTSHEDDTAAKALITVDSTKPSASIYDKNSTTTTAKEKKSDKESYSVGDTITFTAKFDTTNYVDNGTGNNGSGAKQVYKYVISDTLPEYLSDVNITSVTVGGAALNPTPSFSNKQFEIAWVDENGTSKYAQGAEIVVTYTAKLTSVANIGTANTNTISIQPYTDDETPYKDSYSVENVIKTYAAALKKTDGTNALAGAEFTVKGLTVTGDNGVYTVVSYDPTSTVQSSTLKTDADGKLYIIGLASDVKLSVTETKAPEGYNLLTAPVEVPAQTFTTAIYKENGTVYYDAKGNVVSKESSATSSETVEKNLDELDAAAIEVVNESGVELPSTGGIGTTIFYILGTLLVVGCGIVLVSRRRMENNK